MQPAGDRRRLNPPNTRDRDPATPLQGLCPKELNPVFTQNHLRGTSLVVHWLRICLLTQGTRVRALVWEDPTCCGATKPVRHSY